LFSRGVRRLTQGITGTVLFLILALVFVEANVIYFGFVTRPERSDCIIVLGCKVYGTTPSPFLAARVNEGVRLLNEGLGDYIIVSGGKGPGEGISEAESMKNLLVSQGVDPYRIIVEDESGSTYENIRNSGALMAKNGFKSAVIVSNKYHLKRASLLAERMNISATFSGVLVSRYPTNEAFGFVREAPALIKAYIWGGS